MAKQQQPKKAKNQDFLDLCAWIEKEIMGYDENQKLQTKAVMRLQGLRRGQGYANTKVRANGNYSYDVILNTFKINKLEIQNAVRGKNFKSEEAKMAYVCAIVRGKINDVYDRMKSAEKSVEKIEQADTKAYAYQGAGYQPKKKEYNDKFEELW